MSESFESSSWLLWLLLTPLRLWLNGAGVNIVEAMAERGCLDGDHSSSGTASIEASANSEHVELRVPQVCHHSADAVGAFGNVSRDDVRIQRYRDVVDFALEERL